MPDDPRSSPEYRAYLEVAATPQGEAILEAILDLAEYIEQQKTGR